jgi:hypothetical protein
MGLNHQSLLIIAYLLPVVLLSLLLLRNPPREKTKWLLLACLPIFYIGHYLGIQQLYGWPSTATLPDKFILLGQQIIEPDKQKNTTGYIDLWVQAESAETPRLHRLPYSKTLHQQLSDAQQRQTKGKVQQGERISGGQPNTGKEKSTGDQLRFSDRKIQRPVKPTN